MITRRSFMKIGAAGTLTLYAHTALGGRPLLERSIPGGTLAPRAIPRFVTPLVIPPAMPDTGTAHQYSITVRQFVQQILPPSLPPTTVWSYGASDDLAGTLNYPAFTIEAMRGAPVLVTWINGLTDGGGNFLPHLLPVDPTLHWANPAGGAAARDTRPAPAMTPGPYVGPVPMVTHVHGMAGVADWSDGYTEAWYLPDAVNIPAGHATEGTWYSFFKDKAAGAGVTGWGPGYATFRYPNHQRPSTAWYHDHTLGMTRLNVYAGPAGFYLIRSADPADNPTTAGGAPAVLPGPAPRRGDAPGTRYYEIPMAIQDRSFDLSGALFYPDTRAFFDGFAGPYVPRTDVPPIWNPEFLGNCMLVNGNTWPKLDVEPRRYRLRLLNGCQARSLILRFGDPSVEVWQIGAEGGFLRAPVRIDRILMAPAERADVIVDFSRVKPGRGVTLENVGPDAPLGGRGFRPADPQSTGQVMRFDVVLPLATGGDPSTPPAQLVMPGGIAPIVAAPVRRVALAEQTSAMPGVPAIPVEARAGTFDPAVGLPTGLVLRRWADPVSETPAAGATETWEIYNFTVDAHPVHVHEVLFRVVDRQRLDAKTGRPIQTPTPPGPTEDGYKDTVIAYPGEVTRVQMTFDTAGQYVWHCHIVEHEDNEMMRPLRVGPEQAGQPTG